jgi:hypothetical protein
MTQLWSDMPDAFSRQRTTPAFSHENITKSNKSEYDSLQHGIYQTIDDPVLWKAFRAESPKSPVLSGAAREDEIIVGAFYGRANSIVGSAATRLRLLCTGLAVARSRTLHLDRRAAIGEKQWRAAAARGQGG